MFTSTNMRNRANNFWAQKNPFTFGLYIFEHLHNFCRTCFFDLMLSLLFARLLDYLLKNCSLDIGFFKMNKNFKF
jgi:hypothetical protein